MKIFCIGLNKTGTTSLHKAFQILGINSMHSTEFNRKLMGEIIAGKDDLLNQYDAFTESEAFRQNWQLLAAKFKRPDYKIIMTTRNLRDWINSRIVHVLHLRLTKPEHDWSEIDTVSDAKMYERHHMEVEAYFKTSPRFLKIDITAGQGWDVLCPFLDKPIPQVPFPIENTSSSRIHEIAAKLNPPSQIRSLWLASGHGHK